MSAGELVVMDYAGSLDYLTVDITRTWPASGKFSPTQRAIYEVVLEANRRALAGETHRTVVDFGTESMAVVSG